MLALIHGAQNEMKVSELRQHAALVGVDAHQIEEARDGHTPKQSLIELIDKKRQSGADAGAARP